MCIEFIDGKNPEIHASPFILDYFSDNLDAIEDIDKRINNGYWFVANDNTKGCRPATINKFGHLFNFYNPHGKNYLTYYTEDAVPIMYIPIDEGTINMKDIRIMFLSELNESYEMKNHYYQKKTHKIYQELLDVLKDIAYNYIKIQQSSLY